MTFNFKEKKYKEYECPTCHQKKCFEHCNHCGADIKWTNHLGDPWYEINKYKKKVRYAFNKDDSVHRCMLKGSKEYINTTFVNEYVIDEHRTYTRWSGPVFKCSLCGRRDDLPRMLEFHKDDPICNQMIWDKLSKEKPTVHIDLKNHKLDEDI